MPASRARGPPELGRPGRPRLPPTARSHTATNATSAPSRVQPHRPDSSCGATRSRAGRARRPLPTTTTLRRRRPRHPELDRFRPANVQSEGSWTEVFRRGPRYSPTLSPVAARVTKRRSFSTRRRKGAIYHSARCSRIERPRAAGGSNRPACDLAGHTGGTSIRGLAQCLQWRRALTKPRRGAHSSHTQML